MTPQVASASFFDKITRVAKADTTTITATSTPTNSQKMALAESNIGPNNLDATTPTTDTPITSAALTPKVGPVGSAIEVAEIPESGGQIIVYTVHAGDTIGSIAQMFGVTRQTVMSANDLSAGEALTQGDVLAIPPVSGRMHLVKKNDTLATLAKKYSVPALDIAVYNDLDADSTLTVGDSLVIPDINAETVIPTEKAKDPVKTPATKQTSPKDTVTPKKVIVPTTTQKVAMSKSANEIDDGNGPLTAHPMRVNIKVDLGKALLRPIPKESSVRTQGAHDIYGSAVDLGAKTGTPILAAADGTVVLARRSGYNGGYGQYVIIMSNINGNVVQTIYAHMSEVIATVGQEVRRGDVIGKVGATGRATGPHVHFEVHGAFNPLTTNPNYTGE